MKNKSENNKKPEINTDHNDLFILLDFLQEKVKKLDQKEKEFEEFQEKIYDYLILQLVLEHDDHILFLILVHSNNLVLFLSIALCFYLPSSDEW